MRDAYYYFYYLSVILFKKVIKRPLIHGDVDDYYYNGGGVIVTFFIICNLLCILPLAVSNIKPYSGYFVGIPACIFNYYLFAVGNKGKKIFEEYDRKFNASPNKKRIVIIAIIYGSITILLTALVIVIVRNNYDVKIHH